MLYSCLLRLLVSHSLCLSQFRFKYSLIHGWRSYRIILYNSYLVDLLSTKWSYHVKVTMLKQAIIQNQIALKYYVLSIVAATPVLLAFLSVPCLVPGQALAQITPSLASESTNGGLGFMAQDSANPVQNSTSANITQLATIPPAANLPITPSSFTPVIEETKDSDDSTSSNDDDDESDSSSDSDDDDDNDNGDNDGDGGGSSAFTGGGGAFAFAG